MNSLTDFEFRVWWTYELAADDYGVMRRSAVVLQAANDSLAKRSIRVVDRGLDRVVEVGLVVPFEHQGEWYVCQLDWQDFQKVRYPRESHQPSPPAVILAQCSGETRELFQRRSRNLSEIDPSLPHAGAREEANAKGLRQEAEAGRAGGDEPPVLVAYRAHWKHAYGHECSLILKPLEYMQFEQQRAAHGEQKLVAAIAAYFATDDAFVRKARHPLALFLRDPLKYLAKEPIAGGRPKGCRHEPACADDAAHTKRDLADRKAAS